MAEPEKDKPKCPKCGGTRTVEINGVKHVCPVCAGSGVKGLIKK